MKSVHKLTAIFAVLTLTAALLTGCQVTSPDDPEFREDWKESMDEMQKDWDAWKQEHKNGWTIAEGKDHYWRILDADGEETGAVRNEEQVKALDDLLSDDGRWGMEQPEEPDDPVYSYIYCQEKTLLAGQDPEAEREYEELVRFTISASEDVVTMRILEELPSLLGVDLGDYLTFTIDVPAETAEALRNPAQFTE